MSVLATGKLLWTVPSKCKPNKSFIPRETFFRCFCHSRKEREGNAVSHIQDLAGVSLLGRHPELTVL